MYDRAYQSEPSSTVQKQNVEKAERKGMYLPSQSFDPFSNGNTPQSGTAPVQMMEDDQKKKKHPQAKMDSTQLKEKKKKQIQKKAVQRNSANSFGADFSSKGAITAMPRPVQQKMENSFGADFSNVAIHKDSGSATNMGALAYAQGDEIYFAPEQYNPETRKGQELLGHELTHVVQQRQGRVQATTQQGKGMAVNDDPALEREADEMGAKAAEGKNIEVKRKGSGIQKKPDKLIGGDRTKFTLDEIKNLIMKKGGIKASRTNDMTPSMKAILVTISFESLSLHVYDNDGSKKGNATIGFGHKLHNGPITKQDNETYKNGITKSEAVDFLMEDIHSKIITINNFIRNREELKPSITQDQFDVVFDLYFNAGTSKATKFLNKLVKLKQLEAKGNDKRVEKNKNNLFDWTSKQYPGRDKKRGTARALMLEGYHSPKQSIMEEVVIEGKKEE